MGSAIGRIDVGVAYALVAVQTHAEPNIGDHSVSELGFNLRGQNLQGIATELSRSDLWEYIVPLRVPRRRVTNYRKSLEEVAAKAAAVSLVGAWDGVYSSGKGASFIGQTEREEPTRQSAGARTHRWLRWRRACKSAANV